MAEIDKSLPIERVILSVARLAISKMFDDRYVGVINQANLTPEVFFEPELKRMIVELNARIAQQRITEIKHPADWWQAVKERWFLKWMLARWPVRYTLYEVRAYYPDIAIPEHKSYLEFYRLDNPFSG